MSNINLIWFKRDLRLSDHAPLKAAIESGKPCVLLYIFEKDLVNAPQSDERHWRFVYQSLEEMREILKEYAVELHVFYADPLSVFKNIHQEFGIAHLYSHYETGIDLTFKRDKNIQQWCKNEGINWKEYAQNGVIRGQKNRKDWSEKWHQFIQSPLENVNLSKIKTIPLSNDFISTLSQEPIPISWQTPIKEMQPGGERQGRRYLETFLSERVKNYSKHISKPLLSRKGCSRLSPYLAWGNLSIREVYQLSEKAKSKGFHLRDLVNFQSRLQWHCHFIQKFEMEERMEFESMNKGFHKFEMPENPTRLNAWKEGRTGYPLIDACMRCLKETGYINFRMRAMLVSFLTHHLEQNWKTGANHLAQYFLDFEPGIHYPQLQMQAGVTGINTVRIYNPVKQSKEQDEKGEFIKKWIPELNEFPLAYIHEPWKISPLEAKFIGFELGKTYPFPIVELESAAKKARDYIWKSQKDHEVVKEAERILKKHTLNRRIR
jgi:deoxyribodipyrimidine photo-lyase